MVSRLDSGIVINRDAAAQEAPSTESAAMSESKDTSFSVIRSSPKSDEPEEPRVVPPSQDNGEDEVFAHSREEEELRREINAKTNARRKNSDANSTTRRNARRKNSDAIAIEKNTSKSSSACARTRSSASPPRQRDACSVRT